MNASGQSGGGPAGPSVGEPPAGGAPTGDEPPKHTGLIILAGLWLLLGVFACLASTSSCLHCDTSMWAH